MAAPSSADRMFCATSIAQCAFDPRDVLGVEALVEIDRGVDAAHDLRRTTGKAAAPQRIRRSLAAAPGFFAPVMRCDPSRSREDETMRWRSRRFVVGAAGRWWPPARLQSDKPGVTERVRLGEFIPVTPPLPAPAISFADLSGNTVSLSEFAGKIVLVNLWATWCEPCLREMPSLERMQSRLGDKITVLAISEDRGGSKIVEPFIGKLGLKSVKTYLDPKSARGTSLRGPGSADQLPDRSGRKGARTSRRCGGMGLAQAAGDPQILLGQ